MSDLGKLTYYLGIEVIQGAGIIKQGRYAQGILCDTKVEVCNTTPQGNVTQRCKRVIQPTYQCSQG
uniref:Reverse transcriptase Ty1/copia-type domain-containing protein n=1 Tax=Brassica oleracea TaxID=3712 RepID=A0A3P6DB95_BRAOL|nr:unnamed protein product [Brassica oleracea]